MYFYNFTIVSPFGKGVALYLNKFESPSLKDVLCQVWLNLAQWFRRRRFLKVVNKFESPSPRDTLCQVWLNLAQWFRRRFLNVVNVFLLFRNYLFFGKSVALHFPFTQGCFVPSLVESGQIVLEKIIRSLHSTLTISLL